MKHITKVVPIAETGLHQMQCSCGYLSPYFFEPKIAEASAANHLNSTHVLQQNEIAFLREEVFKAWVEGKTGVEWNDSRANSVANGVITSTENP